MRLPTLLLILAAMLLAAFFLGRQRALSLARPAGGIRSLHSLPRYYGYYAALGAVLPGIALLLMMAQTVIDILMKNLMGAPIEGNLEIMSVYHMVAIVFLPLAIVELKHEHINVDLLVRLFHEEAPRIFDAQPVRFGCTCSEDRVRRSLSIYSARDIATMTTDEGRVTADCQFCGAHYDLDPATLGFEAGQGEGD